MDKVLNFFWYCQFRMDGKLRRLKTPYIYYWRCFWVLLFILFLWNVFFPFWDKVIRFLNYVIWG